MTTKKANNRVPSFDELSSSSLPGNWFNLAVVLWISLKPLQPIEKWIVLLKNNVPTLFIANNRLAN